MGIEELGNLLIHSDTTDGDTTFVDSAEGHTITPSGSPSHEDTHAKFSATSMEFTGSDAIVVTNDGDFNLGTDDFTIDYWVWKSSYAGNDYHFDIGANGSYLRNIGGVIEWKVGVTLLLQETAPPINQWVHIALVKYSGTTTLYYNGVSQGSTGASTPIGSSADLAVGNYGGLTGFSIEGWIDEFRLVKGTAEWTSEFTPYAFPYGYWDGIVQSPEIIITLSNSSNTQIGVSSPESSIAITQSPGDLFVGVTIQSPEIIIASSHSSTSQISITQPEVQIAVGALSNVQLQLSSPEIIISTAHSINEIFTGVLIQTPEIIIASGASTDLGLFLASPEIILASDHDSDLAILLASPEIIISLAIEAAEEPTTIFTTRGAGVYYLFSLTKVPGISDIEIPISSFQSRLRDGTPSWLSVVIPGLDYSGAISVRADADMVVEMAYKRGGSYIQREEIARVTLENVMIYQGANNQSITLSGHRTNTYPAKGFRTRQSPTYYRLSAEAKATYRFPRGDFDLNPGDTFTVGADVFEVGLITYIIGGRSQQMEVKEA